MDFIRGCLRLLLLGMGLGALKGVEASDLRAIAIVALCVGLWFWREVLGILPDGVAWIRGRRPGFFRAWVLGAR